MILLSYPRIAVHNNDRTNQLKINIDVTLFVICYRISKGTPNLNMNGNQSLILFLIHHPNQRWNNSRWVINFYKTKENYSIQFHSVEG